jgi:hypothetical protein
MEDEPIAEEVVEPSADILEIPIQTESPKTQTKPQAKARGKRGPDKKARAKPKPKAKPRIAPVVVYEDESSDESVDEATVQELHSLHLLRSVRNYESQRHARKQQLYASWFGH